MARLDNIASYLRGSQRSPLDSALLQRSLRTTSPTMVRPEIPDVGQFGTPGSLPTNPGPIDPPILTGDYPTAGPNIGPPRNDYWTRMDPSMGIINPSLTINPGSGGGPPPVTNYGGPNLGGINLDPNGILSGGNRGPQGTIYGTDPNTGQPIYNVTGSPRPGFFDSKTGKLTEAVGAGALNFFVPGLGFVTKAIFDAVRRGADRRNTGTDLTKNQPPPTTAPPPAPMGPPSVPPGGALFGFRPSQGGGTPHFDYTTGRYTSTVPGNPLYTTTPGGVPNTPVSEAPVDIRFAQNSGTGNYVADQTTKDFLAAGGYKGTPNRAVIRGADRP
jgi:hypothetical protein